MSDEINGLALLRFVRARVLKRLEPDDLFWLVSATSDDAWGSPLVSDPPPESEAKMHAVSDARCAIRDAFGVVESYGLPRDLVYQAKLNGLDRAIVLLETGRYDYDEKWRRTWRKS